MNIYPALAEKNHLIMMVEAFIYIHDVYTLKANTIYFIKIQRHNNSRDCSPEQDTNTLTEYKDG